MNNEMPTGYTDGPNLVVDTPNAPYVAYSHAPRIPDGSPAERATRTIEAVASQFEKYLGTVDVENYTYDGLRATIQRFNGTDADRAIDAAVTEATTARDTACAEADAERASLVTAGDAAQESRNSRYWDRTRRMLDVQDTAKLDRHIGQLIADADTDQLGVLVQELPSYFRSRGTVADATIELAVRRRAPAYAVALERARAAEKSLAIVKFNAASLRQRMAGTHTPAGWQRPHFADGSKYDPARVKAR